MAILKIINHSGKYRDSFCAKDLLHYLADPHKTPHRYFGGLAVSSNSYEAALQMDTLRKAWNKEHQVQLRHTVLFFDPKELSTKQYNHISIADYFGFCISSYYSDSYQIFYAVHEDTAHLHIHFVMNMLNYRTGKQHPGTRQDFYHFLAHVNSVLALHDIKASYVPDDDFSPTT